MRKGTKLSLLEELDNIGECVKKEDGCLYVALHKEFNKNHHVIVTQNGDSMSFEECKRICDKANKNGFNFRPYKHEVSNKT